jgi:hypothetical protein
LAASPRSGISAFQWSGSTQGEFAGVIPDVSFVLIDLETCAPQLLDHATAAAS